MMKKIQCIFMSLKSVLIVTNKKDNIKNKKNFLLILKPKIEFNKLRNNKLYNKFEANFSVIFKNETQELQLKLSNSDRDHVNWWAPTKLFFRLIPKGSHSKKKIYLSREDEDKNSRNPFLSCSPETKGFELHSDYEILEFVHDENYKVLSLAINFKQYTIDSHVPHLFGCLRYYSSFPAEANTLECLGREKVFFKEKPKLFLYYNKYKQINGKSKIEYLNLFETSNFDTFNLNVENNLAIFFYDQLTDIVFLMEFVDEKNNAINKISNKFSKNYQVLLKTNINDLSFLSSTICNITQIETDGFGNIKTLAFNFKIEGSNLMVTEGSFRFNSNVPINFVNPFTI